MGDYDPWRDCSDWSEVDDGGGVACDDPPHRERIDTPPDRRPSRAGQFEIRIGDLEEFLAILKKQIPFAAVVVKLPALKSIASELFLGDVQVQLESDPEIDDCHYFVFNVAATGDPREISSLRREWYRRTTALLKDSYDMVRLSISVSE